MAEVTAGSAVGSGGSATKTLPWAKWLRRGLVAAVVLPVVYFAVTFVQVWRTSRRDGARLAHAADLWRRRIAPVVVVTGGKAVGDRFTESQAGANYLHTKGVPDEAILREATGR